MPYMCLAYHLAGMVDACEMHSALLENPALLQTCPKRGAVQGT